MGTQAPFLPAHGEEEQKLFDLPVHTSCPNLDFCDMALKWCPYVNGIKTFPKLPVHMRTRPAAWLRNQRVREAVKMAASGEAFLARINAENFQALLPTPIAAPRLWQLQRVPILWLLRHLRCLRRLQLLRFLPPKVLKLWAYFEAR